MSNTTITPTAVTVQVTGTSKTPWQSIGTPTTITPTAASLAMSAVTAVPDQVLYTPQLWFLTSDLYLVRWQDTATSDMGTAIPAWNYSTGFDITGAPGVIKGMLVDTDGEVTITIAKTIAAIEKKEARVISASPADGQDEVWIAGTPDFRGQKFRFEFEAPNDIQLRRAHFERELVDAKGG